MVIGNSNYKDKDDFLVNTVNDASSIASKLHNVGFDVTSKNLTSLVE